MKKLFKLRVSDSLPVPVGEVDSGVVAMAYSDKTGDLLSANFTDRTVRFCFRGNEVLFRVPKPGKPNGLCVSGNGLSAIVRDDLGRISWQVGIVSSVVRPLVGRKGVDAFCHRYRQADVRVDKMNGICQIPGAVLITADDSHCLFAVCDDSAVRVVGGNGSKGFSVAASLQTSMLDSPGSVCSVPSGLLCLCDSGNGVIRVVNPSGMRHVSIFGNPAQKSKSDGGAASARLVCPSNISAVSGGAAFVDGGRSLRLLDLKSSSIKTMYESAGFLGPVACSPDTIYFVEDLR